MSSKKTIVIVISCLVLAGVITWATRSDDSMKLPDMKGQSTWMKCSDADCDGIYEIELNQYYRDLKEKQKTSMGFGVPGITCEKCDKDTAFKAIKCEKCVTIFIEDSGSRSDYADRCPECKFSKIEQKRKKRSN